MWLELYDTFEGLGTEEFQTGRHYESEDDKWVKVRVHIDMVDWVRTDVNLGLPVTPPVMIGLLSLPPFSSGDRCTGHRCDSSRRGFQDGYFKRRERGR